MARYNQREFNNSACCDALDKSPQKSIILRGIVQTVAPTLLVGAAAVYLCMECTEVYAPPLTMQLYYPGGLISLVSFFCACLSPLNSAVVCQKILFIDRNHFISFYNQSCSLKSLYKLFRLINSCPFSSVGLGSTGTV